MFKDVYIEVMGNRIVANTFGNGNSKHIMRTPKC
jgi:hypothetical protein